MSIIQSIQQVSIVLASATSATATISAVTTANTAIFWNGFTSDTSAPTIQNSTMIATLTNSTTVTVTRVNNASSSQTVKLTIVEFVSSAIQSIQYGSALISSGTATISSVNTSNAFVLYNGWQRGGTGTSAATRQGACALTGATTVTVYGDFSDNSATVGFCVVEFKAGILAQAAQPFSISMTSVASNTATITSASTSNSMIAWGGCTIGGTVLADFFPSCTLTNSTTVTANRISTSATTTVTKGTVLTFATGYLKSVQRGVTTITTSAATATSTITAVDTSKTIVNFLGNKSSNANSACTQIQATNVLTNSTTITAAVNTTPAGNNLVSFEAIEFGDAVTGTVAVTEANDTVVATGLEIITGTSAVTEANDTVVATGSVQFTGTVAVTEANDTVVATGLAGIRGGAAVTEADDTVVATGLETITGTSAVTEANDTVVGTGVAGIRGSATITEADDTVVATGLETITGTSAVTEADDTVVATGLETITGTSAVTEADDTVLATGLETITGTSAVTEANDTVVATGLETITGTSAITEANDTSSAAGQYGNIDISVPLTTFSLTSGAALYQLETITCTGEPVPAEHFADSKKLDADAYIELFEITLSDKLTKLYLKMNHDATWQGNTYEGFGIKITGVASYADDQTSRPALTLHNPQGVFSYLVDQGLLENAIVVRIRVLKEHLDANLPIYRKQRWRVTRVASLKSNLGVIGLELRDMLDGQNFLLPPRMFIPPDFPMVNLG